MTSKRLFFVLTGLLALLVVGIVGSAYGINRVLETKSNKLLTLKAKQASLSQEQTQLVQMKKDIVTYNNLYQISRVIVPESKDQTETVRQIVNLANRNGVSLESITFPASNLGTGSSPLATTKTAPGTTGTASPTGTAVTTNPALSQLVPVSNIPGVYDLQITVASATSAAYEPTYTSVINFLSSLEQNRLTAQVSQIDIVPNAADHTRLSFTLSLDIFIKPQG